MAIVCFPHFNKQEAFIHITHLLRVCSVLELVSYKLEESLLERAYSRESFFSQVKLLPILFVCTFSCWVYLHGVPESAKEIWDNPPCLGVVNLGRLLEKNLAGFQG